MSIIESYQHDSQKTARQLQALQRARDDRARRVEEKIKTILAKRSEIRDILSEHAEELAGTVVAMTSSPDCLDFAHSFVNQIGLIARRYAEDEIADVDESDYEANDDL